jgi:hypothetical protein
MIGVALALDGTQDLPGVDRFARELAALAVPRALFSHASEAEARRAAADAGLGGAVLAPLHYPAICESLGLPAERIWIVSHDWERTLQAAVAPGFRVVYVSDGVGIAAQLAVEAGADVVPRVDVVLELIREPYTRSLLMLRHLMRSALEWRPGHVINPEDVV